MINISNTDKLLPQILFPYKEQCRYLKTAYIDEVTAYGYFYIPEPCYVNATGHVNAVDVTISFNQLAYLLIYEHILDGKLKNTIS